MGRAGMSMAGLALVTVALSMLIPALGWFIVAPLTALIIGAGAGWWASKLLGRGGAGVGAGAGALAGLGALLGSVLGLVVFAVLTTNNPAAQAQINDALETIRQQNPDAELDNLSSGDLRTGLTGLAAVGGGCIGLFNLFLATIGGLIAGVVYGRNRGAPAMAPAGSYSTTPGTLPQSTNFPASSGTLPRANYPSMTESDRGARTYPSDDEGGARIYPDNERRE